MATHAKSRVLLAALGALSVTAPATAEDARWSGFYVGGNASGSHDTMQTRSTLDITQISNLFVTGRGLVVVPGTIQPVSVSKKKTSFTGGVQAGYQFQTGNIVIGIEGDFDPFSRNSRAGTSFNLPPTALTPATAITAQSNLRINNAWSLRARLGLALNKTLIYGTGGYASARARMKAVGTFTNPGGLAANCSPAPCQADLGPEGPVVSTAHDNKTLGGWTIGLGAEQALNEHLSVGLEFRHTDFGSKRFSLHDPSVTNTGPETVGDDAGHGTIGFVSAGSTRVHMRSDALGLKLNWGF
jgi:outer membrane immunogenic protein